MRDDDLDPIAFALTARPDRLETALLALTPEIAPSVREAKESLAALALALPGRGPRTALRDRLLATVAERTFVHRRALLVIDMIGDHLAPGAALEVPRARAIVPALRTRIGRARDEGIPIVYVVDVHEEDDPDLEAWGAHAIRGTEGAAVWAPLAPREGDLVVEKPSYSAFHATTLEATLAPLDVDTLVLTGCLTEIGLFSTATDAMQLGYDVEVPLDSQAGTAEQLERATLAALSLMAPHGPTRRARRERRPRSPP